jgi:filamentous hemagglutinin family protein
MNKAYRLIWSKAKERWIVAAEIIRGNSGPPPVTVAAATVISAVLALSASAAYALPTGGQVAAGQVAISTPSATQMNITQGTNQAIINWNSFGIGSGEAVNISQPSASSTLLNRVLGNNPSEIFGSLTANGRVFLTNPSGILFAPGVSVNVGGLVASSLNIKDSDFLAGNYSFFKDGTAGSVINQGNISGGFVALLGNSVENAGTIVTTKGSTGLAAGDEITLGFDPNGLMAIKVDKGTYNAQVSNSGVIEADGGTVVMTAKAADALLGSVVNNSGIIRAQTMENRAGSIVLLSDMEHGETVVGGTLDASAPNGGDGGFIETSAAKLKIAEDARILTGSTFGKGGLWLLDPNNISIQTTGPDANITGNPAFTSSNDTSILMVSTLEAALNAGGNVSVTTTTSGINGQGGDITVANDIAKTNGGSSTLTLNAHRDININGTITSSGTGNMLNLVFNADSDRNSDGAIILTKDVTTNGGSVTFGSNNTYTVGTAIGGSGLRTISTAGGAGGAISFYGDVLMGQSLTVNSGGGAVLFDGKVDSGNTYALSASTYTDWTVAKTDAGTDANHYLVTITSALENSLVRNAAAGVDVFIGGFADKTGNNYTWRWKTGPEGLMDSGNGMIFATSSNDGTTASHTLTPVAGAYNNWTTGEPNGNSSQAMQIWYNGGKAQWDNLPVIYTGDKYVQEISGASATLTANAGSGNVTFGGAVGSSKALALLNVTSTGGIAINGGAVTTEGAQTYNGNVTLGAASTVLTQTAANTDFTLQVGKSITNATGADASLTMKTTGNILMNSGSSISSTTDKLNTVLWSDSDNSGSGYIFIYDGNTISTKGGNIVMAGGLDDGANGGTASDGMPDGFATSATVDTSGVGIGRNSSAVASGTTIQSDGGNIFIKGKSTAGSGVGMGINFSYGGTLNAGTGTLTMIGESSSYAGVELSSWVNSAGASYLDINAHTVNISGTSSNPGKNGLASSQLNNEYTRITAGAGGISLYGHNTADANRGIEISLNATTTDGGAITLESPNIVNFYNGANAHSMNAGSGNLGIKANTLSIGASNILSGSGSLTIKPYTDSRAILLGGADASKLALASSYFSTNFADGFSNIIIGNATQAGAMSIGAITPKDKLTLYTQGSATQTGAITGNQALELLGTGGSYALTNTSNAVASLTASTGSVSYVDSDALSLGAITGTGLIDIATLTDNLTLTGEVQTTNATANAIKMNAGKNTAAGTSTGGNIIVSGGSISLTGGGAATATLYSGSVDNSVGLTTLVGSGSGRFRYNSDEAATNYATALVAGTNAIYREQPTVTTTASNDTRTYSGVGYSGGNGVTYGGFVNGDTSASLGGALAYGGTSQGAINVGSYTITPSGYTNGLGYVLAYADGTLTIGKASATVTANSGTVTYNGANQSVIGITTTGLVNGESASVLDSITESGGSGRNAGSFSHSASGSDNNYDLTFVNGSLTINKKDATVSGVATTKTYSGIAQNQDAATTSGFINGDAVTVSGEASGINAGTYTSALTVSGVDSSNYNTTVTNAGLTIDKAHLTVTADNQSRLYGTANPAFTETISGFVNGEDVSVVTGTLVGSSSATTSTGVGTATITASAAGLSAANYDFTTLTDGTLTIDKAHLTVTADNKSRTYGAANPAFTETISGFVNGEDVSVVTGTPIGSSTATNSTGVGTAIITASAAGLSAINYDFTTLVNGTMTITAAPTPPVTDYIPDRPEAPPTVILPNVTPLTPPALPGYPPAGGTSFSGGFVDAKPLAVTTAEFNSFVYAIPMDTFTHADAKATVSLTVRMADGSPLPAWMSFDPVKKVISGIPPQGLTGDFDVIVIANDQFGGEMKTTLKVRIRK